MYFTTFLCFVDSMFKILPFIWIVSSVQSDVSNENSKKIMLLDDRSSPTHKETAKLIYLINQLGPKTNTAIEDDPIHQQGIGDVKFDNWKKNQNLNLEEVMEIVQKNYDAGTKFESHRPLQDRGERVHVISNPEVLNIYKKKLVMRRRHRSTSSSSSASDDYDLGRRNAAFRLFDDVQQSNDITDILKSKNTLFRSKNHDTIDLPKERGYDHMDLKIITISKERDVVQDRKPELQKKKYKEDKWDLGDQKHDSISFEKKEKRRNKDESNEKLTDTYVKRDKIDWGSGDKEDNWSKKKKKDYSWDEKKDKKDSWDEWPLKVKTNEKKISPKWSLDTEFTKNEWKKSKNRDEDSWGKWSTKEYTTKKKGYISKEKNNWKDYALKSPDYYSKPKKKVERSGGSSFGRTPIPFIGKRGIYED